MSTQAPPNIQFRRVGINRTELVAKEAIGRKPLAPRPAAAVVTVTSRCAPDPQGYLVVYLLQGPNYDSTAVAISCDGARHTLQVDVPAGPVSGWMAGKAVATVSLCGTVACTSAFTTVKIT